MKSTMKHVKFTLMILVAGLIMFSGCIKDECSRESSYTVWLPVYLSEDGMRVDIENHGPRGLENPGKIYYYNGLLFINELRQGVHVIDNTDPSNPNPIAFIEIPGNLDIAIKDNILYADMFRDLVTIDITDPLQAKLLDRKEDVFESFIPFIEGLGYLVEYERTLETVTIDCSDENSGSQWWMQDERVLILNPANGGFDASSTIPASVGTGGSMARFTITQDHLYTLDTWKFNVYDVAQPTPDFTNTVETSNNIETIFPFEKNLFIGSNSGMIIYDNNDPSNPIFLSSFEHARACDPVFITGDLAYVTLRSGNNCFNGEDQLDVVNIENLSNPSLVRSYPMDNPHGLSILDNILYLCEGSFGFKVFDAEDPERITDNLLSHLESIQSYDVIALPSSIMLIGQDGLFQYDPANPSNLDLLSTIPVNRK
jgi:hypothetical protein